MTDTSEPTVRRQRGRLEDLLREVCDAIVAGNVTLAEGQLWTPHRLAVQIGLRYPGSGVKPSPGAIADNLKRWSAIGFAVTQDKPLAFIAFTPEAASQGLDALKKAHRANKSAERKASKATAAPAPTPDPEPTAPLTVVTTEGLAPESFDDQPAELVEEVLFN